jgi:hypothetical protein
MLRRWNQGPRRPPPHETEHALTTQLPAEHPIRLGALFDLAPSECPMARTKEWILPQVGAALITAIAHEHAQVRIAMHHGYALLSAVGRRSAGSGMRLAAHKSPVVRFGLGQGSGFAREVRNARQPPGHTLSPVS